jgi:uncharacterized protein YbjT (DUF2867 family)
VKTLSDGYFEQLGSRMAILVTASSGTIGSQVVQGFAAQGAQVRALARDTSKLKGGRGRGRGDMDVRAGTL